MRVNWPGGVGQLTLRRGTGTTAADCGLHAGEAGARPSGDAQLQPVGPAADWARCSTVQAVDEPVERRRRAVRRGHSLLDCLEELRLGLLDGVGSGLSLRAAADGACWWRPGCRAERCGRHWWRSSCAARSSSPS